MITEAQIQERLTKLNAERDQMLANLNVYNGAIQDCEYWLAAFKAPPVNEQEEISEVVNGSSNAG
jgi:hypothetical protein